MKKGKVLKVFLLAFCCAVSFVSCSNEVSESVGDVNISFTTSVSKALNQSGLADEDLTENVEDYYWVYYCDTEAPSRVNNTYDNLDWKKFDGNTTNNKYGKGLGIISKLVKGEKYYFGLRGYKDEDLTNLIWEGFHFETGKEGATSTSYEAVKLTSKTQLVTIDVYSAGVGKLYFNIYAPISSAFSEEDALNKDANGNVKYHQFSYKITSLDGSTVITTGTNLVTFTGDEADTTNKKYGFYKEDTTNTDYRFCYSDIDGDGQELTSGTYLMSIWEEYWHKDNASAAGSYEEVSQRRQVLIINIVPGVNTVVNGSLDSTALTVLDYEADGWEEGKEEHMRVIFHKADAGDVKPLTATVTYNNTGKGVRLEDDPENSSKIARVPAGEYVKIEWTTGTNIRLYVNGLELKKASTSTNEYAPVYETTGTDLFLVRTKNGKDEASLVKWDSDVHTAVQAYTKADYAYLLTIRSYNSDGDEESVSYTIRPQVSVANAITFESAAEFKVSANKNWNGKIYWTDGLSMDDGWIEWDGSEITATQPSKKEVDDKYYLYFRGEDNTKISSATVNDPLTTATDITVSGNWTISASSEVKVSGELTDLLDYTTDVNSMASGAFAGMFKNCAKLTDISGLVFPSFTSDYCYAAMFEGTSVTASPALPATTLSEGCYAYMFSGTNLVTTPALAATEMKAYCYNGMFYGCKKLTKVSTLAEATTLAKGCYNQMFMNCSSFKVSNVNSTGRTAFFKCSSITDTNGNSFCDKMFYGVGGELGATHDITANDTYYYWF